MPGPSYQTTHLSKKGTVTFASFGLYHDDPESCLPFENVDAETVSTRSGIEVTSSDNTELPIPIETSEVTREPKRQETLSPAQQLAKKILAPKPLSLNDPPIPIECLALGSSATEVDADVENTDSGGSISESAESSSEIAVSSNGTDSSVDDTEHASELEEPVLKPLTVPPWHRRLRRPKVAATTTVNNQPLPTSISHEPLKFPF